MDRRAQAILQNVVYLCFCIVADRPSQNDARIRPMDFCAVAIVRHVSLVLVCVEEILIFFECIGHALSVVSLPAVFFVVSDFYVLRRLVGADVLVFAIRVFYVAEVFVSVESQRFVASLVSLDSAIVILPDSEHVDCGRFDVARFFWAEVHLCDLPELYLLIGVHCEHAFERHL